MTNRLFRINCIAITFTVLLLLSCGSATDRTAEELKAKGYEVCITDNGCWYYNTDSICYYNAANKDSTCVLRMGQMLDEFYTVEVKLDKNNRPYADVSSLYDAPVLMDKAWKTPNMVTEYPAESTEIRDIHFCGDKGFVYHTSEAEFGDVWENHILYSAKHPGRIYILPQDVDFTSNSEEITIIYKNNLSVDEISDTELREAIRHLPFTWTFAINYDGEISRSDDFIKLPDINYNGNVCELPITAIGTPDMELKLQPYAEAIKQKVFEERMNRLASSACDIAALNNLFRNKPLAEREVVGAEQIVIGEIVKMDISLTGSKSFEMRTDDRNLTIILYTDDPKFYELHLPATVLFRGTVSSNSIHDWLVFDNCKLEAQLANQQGDKPKDGLDSKLGY